MADFFRSLDAAVDDHSRAWPCPICGGTYTPTHRAERAA